MSDAPIVGRPTAPPPRRRAPARTIIGIVVVILLAVGVAFLLSRCAAGGQAGQGGPGGRGPGGRGRPTITVGVAKAAAGDIPITINALGTVTPAATVNVNARVGGMLIRVDFKEGQFVRKGQELALIDPRPFQVAVEQARGQLLRDQALLANAKVDLQRYQTLKAQDSIAGQQVDTQAALVKQYEAAVVSDRGGLGAAQLNLSFTRIPAPLSGRAGLRQVDPGNQIVANAATPITVVAQVDPIDVVFSVPEDQIPAIVQNGGPTGGGLAVTTYDRTGGSVLAQGVLSTIDNVVDVNTGTVKAKARFANPRGALFPNQFVNITLLVTVLKNQVVVPATAVRHGSQGDFVWVLQTDHTVKQRPVTVGPGTGESFSIAKGLAVGETVITDGGDRLKDGGKVTLPGENPQAGGAGGRFGGRHRHGGAVGSGDAQGNAGQPSPTPAGGGQGAAPAPAVPATPPAFQPPAAAASRAPTGAPAGPDGWSGHHHRQGAGGADNTAPAEPPTPGQATGPGGGHRWRHRQEGGQAQGAQGQPSQ